MARRLPRAAHLLPALLCLFVLGCGGSKTYRVTGKVTFQGKPVPAGKIYFLPDSSKGNTGPSGFADIKNGEYDTGATGGSNPPSGAVIIAVEGLDPAAAPDKKDKSEEVTVKLLFARYEVAADLPAEKSTKNIDVPADASKGPTGPPKKAGEVIP
jgi:hypothetical protein